MFNKEIDYFFLNILNPIIINHIIFFCFFVTIFIVRIISVNKIPYTFSINTLPIDRRDRTSKLFRTYDIY